MKIRVKVFIVVLTVFGLLFFCISKIFTKIETNNFNNLEKQTVADNIDRVKAALDGKFDDLSVKLGDWSQWDDTYKFAQDKNQAYIESNLNNDALIQLRLNFILIRNATGDIIFQKYLKDGNETQTPKDVETFFLDKRIVPSDSNNSFIKMAGIVNLQEGPFMVAIQSITSSDGNAQPDGLIAFGYVIDDSFMDKISKATVLKLDKMSYDETVNNSSFENAKKKIDLSNFEYIDDVPSGNTISGFLLIDDIFKNPALIFRAQMPREIYKVGSDNTRRLNLFLIGMGIFEIIIILMLFELFVLRKIYRLVEEVKLVSDRDNNTERLVVEGTDEFAQLDREINDMLESISKTREEKKESESRFMNLADSAPVMIWASGLDGKIIYANDALAKFLGKSEDELLGDGWTNVVHPDDKERVLDEYASAIKKQEPLSMKYRVMSAKGSYRWIMVEAIVRTTTTGIFKGYVGTAMDVTQFEEIDMEKANYATEVERLSKIIEAKELEISEIRKKLKAHTDLEK